MHLRTRCSSLSRTDNPADKDIGMKQPSVDPSKSDFNKTNSLPFRPSDLIDYAPAGSAEAKDIDIDESQTTNTRLKTRSVGNNVERKAIRRSARIQSLLPTKEIETKGQYKLQCAACNLVINHKDEEHGVIKCTNCTNIFHPMCSGIQTEWYGHFKFQCSKLEIECRKHIKVKNQGRNRKYRGTVSWSTGILFDKKKKDSQGHAEKGTEKPVETYSLIYNVFTPFTPGGGGGGGTY